ncbi:ChrR family anti-sigma-E factor [Ensifer sp. 2YAB10]|uniref:ChrR family anti-sigma-E factor n=1 Tax=unclassified Ensifer TaxID=2633371 RepID=UPI001A3C5BFB|nr:ChrR family anti-sigma-E factor [Ensifer sp. SSB1]MBK5568797.1 cupin domain-containing protein [Ensifer sp. SSB1]
MNIRHHVSDELLVGYASGTLEEGWRLAVATHLALCPNCRARLTLMEDAAGELFESISPVPIEVSSFNRLKERIRAGEENRSVSPREPTKVVKVVSPPTIPEPLRSYLGGDLAELKWKSLGRGAYHIPIELADRSTAARLLRIPAGKPVPEHSHGGRELTLVLSGSFSDGELLFARGDIEEADTSVRHQPLATPEQDCICLAVTDAPLRFSSWFMRLLQPVLRI